MTKLPLYLSLRIEMTMALWVDTLRCPTVIGNMIITLATVRAYRMLRTRRAKKLRNSQPYGDGKMTPKATLSFRPTGEK